MNDLNETYQLMIKYQKELAELYKQKGIYETALNALEKTRLEVSKLVGLLAGSSVKFVGGGYKDNFGDPSRGKLLESANEAYDIADSLISICNKTQLKLLDIKNEIQIVLYKYNEAKEKNDYLLI